MKHLLLIMIIMLTSCATAVKVDRESGKNRSEPFVCSSYNINAIQAAEAAESIEKTDFAEITKRVLKDVLFHARSGYIPDGITSAELLNESICAKVVSRIFWAAFGNENDISTARGVSGDAWMMARNVRSFGGKVYPYDDDQECLIEPGDIIGIYYKFSIYAGRGIDYTHVALVLAVLPNEGPLIIHCFRVPGYLLPENSKPPWPVRVEFLDDFLAGFTGAFEPREIIKPRDKKYR